MTLKDILKYIPNGINENAILVKANEWNKTEQYNVKSTFKAVLVRTTDGDVWLPISAIDTNETSGKQSYDRNTGRYFYDSYQIRRNNKVIFSVRINMSYIF